MVEFTGKTGPSATRAVTPKSVPSFPQDKADLPRWVSSPATEATESEVTPLPARFARSWENVPLFPTPTATRSSAEAGSMNTGAPGTLGQRSYAGIPAYSRDSRSSAATHAVTAGRASAVSSPLAAPIQAKLAVGSPDDPLEHEADRVADTVLRMPDPVYVGREPHHDVGSSPAVVSGRLQRQCASCEKDEDDEEEGRVQRRAGPEGAGGTEQAPAIIGETLRSGRGRPLDVETRAYMEPRFGRDFGQVRVHTDARAAESARAANALAYTVGDDVVFGSGYYAPNDGAGRRLLAHELTHVVQQRSSRSGSDVRLRRKPSEGVSSDCGASFKREFRGKINQEKPEAHNGVPRVYYALTREKKDLPGKPIEPLVAGTELDVGQADGYAKSWRAVCFKTQKMPVQILWVLDKYILNLDAQREKEAQKKVGADDGEKKPGAATPAEKPAVELDGATPQDKAPAPASTTRIRAALALLQNVKTAVLADPKDTAKAIEILERMKAFFNDIITDTKIHETFAGWVAFSQTTVRQDLLDAKGAPEALLRKIKNGTANEETFKTEIGHVVTARRYLEILAGDRPDRKALEAELKVFERETKKIAFEMLDTFRDVLLEQRRKYQDDAAITALCDALGKTTAKADYAESDRLKTSVAETTSKNRNSPAHIAGGPAALEQIEEGKRLGAQTELAKNIAARGNAQVITIAEQHPLVKLHDFPRESLVRADGAAAVKLIIDSYIDEHLEHVADTRSGIDKDIEVIYRDSLDRLMTEAYRRQGIVPGSLRDLAVENHQADREHAALVWSVIENTFLLVFTVMTWGAGGLVVKAAQAVVAVKFAADAAHDAGLATAAFGAGMGSVEPNEAWAIIACLVAAVEVVGVLGKILPAIRAFNEGKDAARFLAALKEQGASKEVIEAISKMTGPEMRLQREAIGRLYSRLGKDAGKLRRLLESHEILELDRMTAAELDAAAAKAGSSRKAPDPQQGSPDPNAGNKEEPNAKDKQGGSEQPKLEPEPKKRPGEAPEEWQRAVAQRQEPLINDLAKKYGKTAAEFRVLVNDYLKRLFRGANLFKRIKVDDLGSVISDGRFKSQFETRTSGGALNPRLRNEVESKVFGFDGNATPVEQRPQYGYVSTHPDGGTNPIVRQYGDTTIKLKSALRDRATFTFGDSADWTDWGKRPTLSPKAVSEPDLAAFYFGSQLSPNDPLMLKSLDGFEPYVEAQIHGGVDVSTIAEVIFDAPPPPQITAQLDQLHIPWRVRTP